MPPLLYWALEDIQQSTIADGFTIVTKTDVACHQWLRHTLIPPQKHAKPVLTRGLLMKWDARFCFVAFEDLEQDEAGDTFTHTFTWTGWTECQTRWFYFWATSWGEKMKSTSPIFSKHFVAPFIFTAVAVASDFDIAGDEDQDYTIASITPSYACRPTYDGVFFGQGKVWGNYWYIRRGALVFDTTDLPSSWSLTKAVLHFMCGIKHHATTGPLCFLDGHTVSLPCSLASYLELRACTSLLASIPYADVHPATWQEIELDPSALSFINPGGDTIIAVREKHELDLDDSNPPDDQIAGYNILSFEVTDYKPYLVIYGQ